MKQLGFCVHGHFYQPSREDPLTGEIPEEKGAFPYKNWNELIYNHCYLPNSELGNYRKISFNFGPTLLDWMVKRFPISLSNIIAQDRENYEMYGVGNALAQPYHHTILPLASKEDKITQIWWGIEDFKFRFGHVPSGIWLPETAVDLETLGILESFGIQFTILAPWQADTENLDITQPYWVKLKDDCKIAVFFYHRGLSTQISFDPLSTVNADVFAKDFIVPNINLGPNSDRPRYLLLASDGELYGHHQPFRDKFLAHLLNGTLKNLEISNVYPGLWLQQHPPQEYINIVDFTSWSCHHGVNRWSTGCDCTPASEWKQKLKDFTDFIGSLVNQVYEETLSLYDCDIWELRNRYIEVILDKISLNDLVLEVVDKSLSQDEINIIYQLLQAQFERQRMYTSCGWFFEDFDRIEPKNTIAYAIQSLLFTQQVTGLEYFTEIEPYLQKIVSNRSGLTALVVYQKFIERIETN